MCVGVSARRILHARKGCRERAGPIGKGDRRWDHLRGRHPMRQRRLLDSLYGSGQPPGRQRPAPPAASGTGPRYRPAPFLLFLLLRSCEKMGFAGESACAWSFYILLVTFMGISPGGARESSPWREPWEKTRTARSPGGAKEPFHGDSPIAGHEGPSYAPTGLARLWAGPTGLTPWAIF